MFTSAKMKDIRKDLELAVSMVESTHNIQIQIGVITFGRDTFKCSLQAALGADGEVANLAKTVWNKECIVYGFNKDDFGKIFSIGDIKYEICGIKPRSTKYPILGKSTYTGKTYKFAASTVLRIQKS